MTLVYSSPSVMTPPMALHTYVSLPQEETEDGGDNCHIKTPENLTLVSKLLKVSGWGYGSCGVRA